VSSPISPDQWKQLESLVDALLDTPPERRAALFAKVSGGDPARQEELERLVAACERTYPLLDQPAAERFAALVDTTPLQAAQLVAGRYRITRELGRGGMATVYLAHDEKHARDVALKVVRSELVATVGSGRFLREIEIAAQLRHPNIVPLYDSGRVPPEELGAGSERARDGILYYVMPYEAGKSLRDRLRRETRLPIDDVLVILRDICDALAYAHERGIIHRDVKPDNILLAGRHALVSDFGVARAASEVATATSTGAGVMLGTPAYMAPEQVAADPNVDHRADIYAVGALAYELLAGHAPFRGEAREILAAQLAQDPEPIAAVRRDVPEALAELVMKCLAKNPAERWQSATEMLPHLEPAAFPGAVPHGSGTSGFLTPSTTLRRRMAGAAVLATAAVIAWIAWSRPSAVAPATSTPQALAVLPFQHGEQDQLQSLALALTIRLIGALGDVPRLDVRSLRAAWPYGDARTPVESIGPRLRVGWIVSGRVDRLGNQNVVSVELTDAATGRLRGRRQVTGVPDNDVPLIEELVAQVAAMLRERIGDHVRLEGWRAGTRSGDAFRSMNHAYDHVREADALMESDVRGATARLRRADSTLERASRADPRWTEPYVQRAWVARKTALIVGRPGAPRDSARAALGTGLAHVEHALRIRPDEPRALEIKGILLHARFLLAESPDSGRAWLATAERLLRRATDADSTLPRALNVLSSIHWSRGELEQARLAAVRAYAADAYTEDARQLLGRLFTIDFDAASDGDARRWCDEYARMFQPDWYVGYCRLMLMGWDSTQSADSAQAHRIARDATAAAPEVIRESVGAQLQTLAAGVLARAGSARSAASLLDAVQTGIAADSTIAREPFGSERLQLEAAVRLRLGQPEVAIKLLQAYMKQRPGSADWLARSRRFRGLPLERLSDAPAQSR
jgi:serine/threonine-protein kinase